MTWKTVPKKRSTSWKHFSCSNSMQLFEKLCLFCESSRKKSHISFIGPFDKSNDPSKSWTWTSSPASIFAALVFLKTGKSKKVVKLEYFPPFCGFLRRQQGGARYKKTLKFYNSNISHLFVLLWEGGGAGYIEATHRCGEEGIVAHLENWAVFRVLRMKNTVSSSYKIQHEL